ncbi:MAG: type II toxin-antitoxin system RelE/ParE family toxin [Ilumatobacter fluminis]|uniref:type II toxin-antitoxin system RelE/ParE family toxin n=1 Tax=Ilumatobacter fluminis TaxID=467091 RepID=UPI0032EF78E9
MRRALRFHPGAEAEMEAAAAFLDERTPGAGNDFIVAVGATMRNARARPRIGSLVAGQRSTAKIRRMRVRPNDYQVVYAVYADHILVVAVAHNKRKPLYWLDRVDE